MGWRKGSSWSIMQCTLQYKAKRVNPCLCSFRNLLAIPETAVHNGLTENLYMYMHISVKSRVANVLAPLPCACANLRRAARAISRLYNRELRSSHIEITQFTLLMTLDRAGDVSQGRLGKLLALDSTSLTRMLQLLKNKGWIRDKEGADRRIRIIGLTPAGRTKLKQAMPHWKRAQDRIEEAIGEPAMNQMRTMLERVASMTAEE
jgi:DNA-binding MarR family transcriptional regulator